MLREETKSVPASFPEGKSSLTEKEAKAKLKEIKKAMNSFPKEVRRQERAHREEMTALEGETPYWESFNQWLCFPAESVEVTCEEAEYDGNVQIPALHVVQDGHYYEISMDPDPKPDCERITRQWRELIQGEHELCAYAAPLQELTSIPAESGAKDGSLWIINCLKSSKGYWDVVTSDNLFENDEHIPNEIEAGSEEE